MNNYFGIVLLVILAFCLVGEYNNRSKINRLEHHLNFYRRSFYYNQYLDSVYFKPLIWQKEPMWEYHEAVDNARDAWFPEGWENKID